jgi:hypothetical protein
MGSHCTLPRKATSANAPVDITLREAGPVAPLIPLIERLARRFATSAGVRSRIVVVVEGFGQRGVFTTIRLGEDDTGPEWGGLGPNAEASVRATFRMLEADRVGRPWADADTFDAA